MSAGPEWQPHGSLAALKRRAEALAHARHYFSERDVLEVQVPCLGVSTVPDLHLGSMACQWQPHPGAPVETRYLQTSPECYLKRWLVEHRHDCYALGPVFRDQEWGERHQPEFTMLEWYRLGMDLEGLVDDVQALLSSVWGLPQAQRFSYQALLAEVTGLRLHDLTLAQVQDWVQSRQGPTLATFSENLDWVFGEALEPWLASLPLALVTDYPACQSAMACVRDGVAKRVEVFVYGIECGNGFQELTCPQEQQARFRSALAERKRLGLPCPPLDVAFLAALERGLPSCAGMAIGVERLCSAAWGLPLTDVMAFSCRWGG